MPLASVTLTDVILLLILFGFIFFGFWTGLIHALGSLVGSIVGVVVASRMFIPLAEKYSYLFGGNMNLAKIVIFLVIFIIVNRLVGLVFWIIEKIFKVISIIPFLKTINRLGGAVLGFIEGVLAIGMTLYITDRFPLGDAFTKAIQGSIVARKMVAAAAIITPLLPVYLQQIRSIIKI